ncbi:FAD-dependent oxidoreductase [Nocardia abscessus]|uniref:flavin monoamine oxidase family protein n=1 Tax=Nocardia TaxID=1817 RepID=UPI001893CD88|nr:MULTISPECIES: FAD-dependent oxidoreductase [Nocardia]MBF6218427.1 FAD-dependent oxidoreductase [Nocardia abscessus]MDE1669972.1 FAD-dependent oxidoreductase [Nocardia gipuzkoensis]
MTDVDFCVIGGGFAGLTAALRLRQMGRSVALLEARDRLGGRTFTEVREDGSWIDRGGAWIGPGQDRIQALMTEFGVPSYKQYTDGEAMMVVDGKQHRYTGTIPWTMSPWAAMNLGAVFLELGHMCKSVPLEAPWAAKKADKWDQVSLAHWLESNILSKPAHDLLETAIAGCYTSAASEVSLLFVLYQMASGGGPSFVLGVKDAAQDARPVGGMGAIYRPMAAELGDSIHLSQPVRCIHQDADGVRVRAEDLTVRARRAIVAVPLAIADKISYKPMLPVDRSFLHQRMPSGSIIKTSVVYDEPFWRGDGLSGQSAAPGSPATITIDACTDTGRPGVLCVIIEGPIARQVGRLDDAERRGAVLGALVERFGRKAGSPVDYIEQNWSAERYSGGGMLSHAPTGVLTQFGHALREPCGRIHWAGTESSAVMCGWIDGAIRSGERAASEVLEHETAVVG